MRGFHECYEHASMVRNTTEELGKKRVGLMSLFNAAILLLVPVVISIRMIEQEGSGFNVNNLGRPLVNIVVLDILLSENFDDEKGTGSREFHKIFLVTFGCTIMLDLIHLLKLSLWELRLYGMMSYVGLSFVRGSYIQIEMEQSETFSALVVNSPRHILNERKSRKTTLFLLVNAGYKVVKFVAGIKCNILELISDDCHMPFDYAILVIGFYAFYTSSLPTNSRFNYGRGMFEVLSGYAHAVFPELVGALIVLEFLDRILNSQDISTNSMLAVSMGGSLAHLTSVILFHEKHHHTYGGIYSAPDQKRCYAFEEMRGQGIFLYYIKAYPPIIESCGFPSILRAIISAQAFS
ncbi:hypothetical protein MLD38_009552 [Melastoma candidum]|uniref:Uncharacterized protein n=1 Tax=Melastoma candidum TaxID=119954 RepID=A0ACB9S295_9MYRT|nr:hypothetical protein MLD38_009552 [Melastoma candidum]